MDTVDDVVVVETIHNEYGTATESPSYVLNVEMADTESCERAFDGAIETSLSQGGRIGLDDLLDTALEEFKRGDCTEL